MFFKNLLPKLISFMFLNLLSGVSHAENTGEKAQMIIKQGKELANEGLKMESLRGSDKMVECGNKMRALQKRVKKLVDIAEGIKPGVESKYSFVRSYIGTNPKRCVSCITSAASTCAQVFNTLDKIDKEFAKLK